MKTERDKRECCPPLRGQRRRAQVEGNGGEKTRAHVHAAWVSSGGRHGGGREGSSCVRICACVCDRGRSPEAKGARELGRARLRPR